MAARTYRLKVRSAFPKSGFFGVIALFFIAFLALFTTYSQAEDQSAKVLAAKALALHAGLENRQGAARDEDIFRVHLLVSVIRQRYPRSREALLLERHRFYGIDIVEIERKATLWAALNQRRAQDIATEDLAETELAASESAVARDAAPLISPRLAPSTTARAPPLRPSRPQAQPSPIAPPAARPRTTRPRPAPSFAPPPVRFSQRELSDRLRRAVVIVVTFTRRNGRLDWKSHGTGFFITDRHILTNDHVVRDGHGGVAEEILIANRELGLSRVRLVQAGKSSDGRGIDTALLEALNVRSQHILPMTFDYREGDAVTIAGYPGRSAKYDRAFQDFLSLIRSGSAPGVDEIPNPKFSTGAIQSVFRNPQGKENLENGFETTGGNSGSPVVNACGFLVGQHYGASRAFARRSGAGAERRYEVDTSKFNYSTAAREIANWLRPWPVQPMLAQGPCPAAR